MRAPAIVTEFLSQGSLRGVLSRKSDVIAGPLVRVLIAMDAAKARPSSHSQCTRCCKPHICALATCQAVPMLQCCLASHLRAGHLSGTAHAAVLSSFTGACGLQQQVLTVGGMQGMEYLHSKKIVHFDLKSANLLLGHRDRRTICKVADFGLSKQAMATFVSGVSSQRGTLPWIAPEIIKTPHAVTEMVPPSCRTI